MSNKKEIRVFLSSTFKDLDEERAYLAKHTFPLLRTYCNRKGVHFSEIDLRWGLTEEDSKNGRIIRLCLDQINDCKPFFIGILGSRYGWIPTMSDLQKDRQLKDNYPELQDSIKESRSVVEIEFEQGMLNDPQTEYQFVYAKQQEKRNPRVEELLGRVRDKELMITEFSSLEELHGAVLYDMQRAVDRYLEEANAPWADEDQLAFMTERLRSYIEHEGYSQKVDDQLALERSMTIVTGESGTGKSALMAHTIERLRQDTDKIVLGHFVGASPASRNSRGIFDHLAEQLKRNYEIDLGSTSTFSSLQDEFAFLLSKINDRGAVIVIDALDQLDEDSQPLDWLPEYLPENVHLLVSTTPGPILKRLRQREWDEFAMEPFDREEREAFVVRYLSDYGKSLNSDHVSAIAANPKCRNPLFLKMLLEEVRLSAHFTNLDETIDHYLSVKDLDGLFQLMLGRLEDEVGHKELESLMLALAVAETGLSMQELAGVCGLPEDDLVMLAYTHDYLFHSLASRFTLFHRSLVAAVWARYDVQETRKTVSQKIVVVLRDSNDTSRLLLEALPQALTIGNESDIIALLSNPEVLQRLCDEMQPADCTRVRAMLFNYPEVSTLIDKAGESVQGLESNRAVIYGSISKLLHMKGEITLSVEYAKKALEFASTLPPNVEAEIRNNYGVCLEELELLDTAAEQYTIAYIRASEIEDSSLQLDILQNKGILEYKRRAFDSALPIFRSILAQVEKAAGYQADHVGALTNIGAVLFKSGNLREAEVYLSKALAIKKALYPDNDPRLANAYNNLGYTLSQLKQTSRALDYLKYALQLNSRLYGLNHLSCADNHVNLAKTYEELNDFSQALLHYQACYDIRSKFLPVSHSLLASTKASIDRVKSKIIDVALA